MEYRQRKALEKIEASHSSGVLLRYLVVGVFLCIAIFFFPENIRSLGYAPIPILFIYGAGVLNLLITSYLIKRFRRRKKPWKVILNTDFYTTFFDNIIPLLFIPVFSDHFISPFWFIPVFSIALLLTHHELKRVHLFVISLCPFVSYGLFALYHLTFGDRFVFMPQNFLFSAAIAALTLYTYSVIINRQYIRFLLHDDQEKADRFLETHQISSREKDVFQLLLSGRSTKEIADKLSISAKTADNHISSIFRKTNTHSRIELYAAYASFYPLE